MSAFTANNNVTLPKRADPIQKLSFAELKDRREKGLCYHCHEKFLPGQECKRLFILQGDWLEEDQDLDYDTTNRETDQSLEAPCLYPEISYSALSGASSPQTMKLYGSPNKQKVYVLIDSGSTHKFLKEQH